MGSRSDSHTWWSRLFAVGLALVGSGSRTEAQVVDQIVVNSDEPGFASGVIRRFDRRLNLLGSTPLSSFTTNGFDSIDADVAILPGGDIWVELLPPHLLVRMDSGGALLSPVVLDDYPAALSASGSGLVYDLTQLPVLQTKVYAVDFSGVVQWFNLDGPASYTSTAPRKLAVASTGDLWMGDATYGACGCLFAYPELTLLDPETGDIVRKVKLPNMAVSTAGTNLRHLAAGVDGTLWATTHGDSQSWLYRVDPEGVLAAFTIAASYNGVTTQIRVDAAGDVWTPGATASQGGGLLNKYDAVDGSLRSVVDLGSFVYGYALGSSGEELFAVVHNGSPFDRKFVRVNLVTGRTSSRVIDPPFTISAIGNGDPTGFIWANVLDQGGDNDGDGATNRTETLAGTSPFDATSRPFGPKVYLDFAPSNNAIILKLSDPDGLLHPTGGLSVPTLSVKVGPFGEVFPILLQFLTFVQISPDGTQATAFFGALPFATGSKLTVDASVADKTGAIGWDWQVTPPGEL